MPQARADSRGAFGDTPTTPGPLHGTGTVTLALFAICLAIPNNGLYKDRLQRVVPGRWCNQDSDEGRCVRHESGNVIDVCGRQLARSWANIDVRTIPLVAIGFAHATSNQCAECEQKD